MFDGSSLEPIGCCVVGYSAGVNGGQGLKPVVPISNQRPFNIVNHRPLTSGSVFGDHSFFSGQIKRIPFDGRNNPKKHTGIFDLSFSDFSNLGSHPFQKTNFGGILSPSLHRLDQPPAPPQFPGRKGFLERSPLFGNVQPHSKNSASAAFGSGFNRIPGFSAEEKYIPTDGDETLAPGSNADHNGHSDQGYNYKDNTAEGGPPSANSDDRDISQGSSDHRHNPSKSIPEYYDNQERNHKAVGIVGYRGDDNHHSGAANGYRRNSGQGDTSIGHDNRGPSDYQNRAPYSETTTNPGTVASYHGVDNGNNYPGDVGETNYPGDGKNLDYQRGIRKLSYQDDSSKPSYNEGDTSKRSYNVGDTSKPSYNEGDNSKPSYNEGDGNKPSYNESGSSKPSYNEGDTSKASYNEGDSNKSSYNEGDSSKPSYNEGDSSQPSLENDNNSKPSYEVVNSKPSYGVDNSKTSYQGQASIPTYLGNENGPSYQGHGSRPSYQGDGSGHQNEYHEASEPLKPLTNYKPIKDNKEYSSDQNIVVGIASTVPHKATDSIYTTNQVPVHLAQLPESNAAGYIAPEGIDLLPVEQNVDPTSSHVNSDPNGPVQYTSATASSSNDPSADTAPNDSYTPSPPQYNTSPQYNTAAPTAAP